ncbi:MAG: hypothetical protein WEB87_03935 [Bacteriovoracaceae bacterium]
MNKALFFLPLIFSFSSSLFAVDDLERERLFKTPEPETLTPRTIRKNKRVFLYNESLLMEDQGGYMEAKYTGNDHNRFSLGYHFSSNYEDFSQLSSLEIMFSRQLRVFTELWISFQAKRTTGAYEALADEVQSANGDIERSGSAQSFTTLGLGGGYRFRALSGFFDSNRMFETVDAYLTYNYHLDGASDVQYQGFGLSADYGLHYRATESFFYGTKLSYNISNLARSEEEGESLPDRSLVFGWLSLGFELGYYY